VNVQEYISSGIVESYVLGLANPEDLAEFERMCAAHSEVRAARDAFERLLERRLMEEAVLPPPSLKAKIFSQIQIETDKLPGNKNPARPVPVIRPSWTRYAAAAAVVLLLGSVALNIYLLNQYKGSLARYDALVATQTQLAASNRALQTNLQDYQAAMDQIRNPQMAVIKMPGVTANPNSLATVYWNTQTKDVYLLVNQLPRPSAEKQYQLWAIVDGKPVDAGIFDVDGGPSFVKLKNIQHAEAFAITLEKKGGSESPTMDAMYVMGKV
jgi:anti-sigma-K factor RskA